MAIEISGPVSKLVASALTASVMRHDAIANNIANVNTPGYKPLKVSFEDQFSRVMSKSMLQDDATLRHHRDSIRPTVIETENAGGINQLDIEMIEMSKNTLRYETLLQGLKNYGSITKMAIKEGKS